MSLILCIGGCTVDDVYSIAADPSNLPPFTNLLDEERGKLSVGGIAFCTLCCNIVHCIPAGISELLSSFEEPPPRRPTMQGRKGGSKLASWCPVY